MYLGDFWVIYMQSKVVREKYGPICLSTEEKCKCAGSMSLLRECDLWFPFPWRVYSLPVLARILFSFLSRPCFYF